MLGIVFGGGGAKGSYEIGVWRALADLGIDERVKIAVGTSIGSLNAALFVQGDCERALDLWNNLNTGKMFNVPNFDELDSKEKLKMSIHSVAGEVIKDGGVQMTEYKNLILQNIDEQKIRNSDIAYGLVTVNITDKKAVEKRLSDIKNGQLADYIVASSSLAPAIKPYKIDGATYIDGGFYDALPINMAVDMGADEIIAVDLVGMGIIQKIRKPDKIKNIRNIRPYWDLGSTLLFEDEIMRRNFSLGYFDTLKSYGAYDGNAYTFIKSSKNNSFSKKVKDKLEKLGEGFLDPKKYFGFADMIVRKNWENIIKERETKGMYKTGDFLALAEIVAEMLCVDPTKIYSVDSLNKKIKQILSQVDIESKGKYDKSGGDFFTNLSGDIATLSKDIATITDEKKRLKYIASEIKKDIENNRELWTKNIAPIFTKEFFAGVYIVVNDLI